MIIQSTRVFIAGTMMKAQIEITGGTITGIYPYETKTPDTDYGNLRIVPGFYDIHTHGYHGYDTSAGGDEGLIRWQKDLPKEGVCGFLPTTLTESHTVLQRAVADVARIRKENHPGAAILGIHMEGPYINRKHAGAQPEAYIVKPTIEEFEEYQNAAEGLIRVITLAPEMDEDFALTKYCASHGVNVSIGHTDTTYETAMLALANGARGFTHTYNAMTGLAHRENGAVGAAFRAHDTYAEAICDGNHSTLAALNIFFREKQDYAIMVSDSLACKGYPAGTLFPFGDLQIIIYPDGSAHITSGRKQLAGSTLHLNDGLRILVEEAGVPFETALNAASRNPMKYLHMDDHKGYIRTGYDADLVVLKDDYTVAQTYCMGVAQL